MENKCKYCGVKLKRDWIALNKKIINPSLKQFLCIDCLADDLDCDVEDLLLKIDEFKEQGCILFGQYKE